MISLYTNMQNYLTDNMCLIIYMHIILVTYSYKYRNIMYTTMHYAIILPIILTIMLTIRMIIGT